MSNIQTGAERMPHDLSHLGFLAGQIGRLITISTTPVRSEERFSRNAERMPHDLSHLGFLAGQIGRLITISTTPVIAGDSFEMDAVGALRLSPLRRGLAIDSTVDIFTFYVPHRHVYGEQW